MADKQALENIKKGTKNLRGTDLSGAKLICTNLTGADLSDANLGARVETVEEGDR